MVLTPRTYHSVVPKMTKMALRGTVLPCFMSCEVAHECSRLKKVRLFNEQKEFFS